MLKKLSKLLLISRPISWPNTAYPFAAMYLVAGGSPDLLFWIATIYFLLPYNLLLYGVNDVFDYESDIKNPRKGGIEGAVEQKEFHPTIIKAAMFFNIPFIVYFLVNTSLLATIVLIILEFFVVAYSVGGLRFKEIPLLDSITSSIHFVGPMIYAISIIGYDRNYLPFVIAFFLWGMASHAFGAVQDIIPDRQGKLSSIATVFGARFTVFLVVGLYLAASIAVILQGWPAHIVGAVGLLYVANTAGYLKVTDATSGKTNKAWRRFIWLNLITGFVVTMVIISYFIL